MTTSIQSEIIQCPGSTSSIIIPSEPKINKIKRRFIILSPTVELGIERECNKTDFLREGESSIGKGGFGEVWKVIHRDTSKSYCIKIVDKRDMVEQRLITQLNTELEIMYKIHHGHSIKLINHFEDEEKFYIIMNYASKGTVFSHMKANNKLPERTAAQYLRETISIIKYLHSFSPKIIHRDIKPENLLLDDDYRIKLCDYGWACYINEGEKLKTFCGTPAYVAPEMIKKQGHDHRVDIWSLGVLLYEMLAGFPPFSGGTKDDLFNNITKIKINWPNDFPSLAKNLILKILRYDPNERISLDEIISHPWFQQNPCLKEEIVLPQMTKLDILLSHVINSQDNQTGTNDNGGKVVRNGEGGNLNNLDGDMTKSFSNIKFNEEDLNVIPNEIDKVRNDNKMLKIQLINMDNQYQEVIKENGVYVKMKEDYDGLKIEYEKMRKEIELYKMRDNDRQMLIKENDEKVKIITVLQEDIHLYHLDKYCIKSYEENIKSLNETLILKEDIITNLNNQINELMHKPRTDANHDSIENKEQKQYTEEDINKIIDASSTKLDEKITQMTKAIDSTMSLYYNKDREIAEIIKHSAKEITTIISLVKESMLQQFNTLYDHRPMKSMKSFETIDLLNHQIQVLQEDKWDNERLRNKIKATDEEITLLREKMEVMNKQNNMNDGLLRQYKDKMMTKDKLIEGLEFKLCDIKNFLFRNMSNDVLNAFDIQFKGKI